MISHLIDALTGSDHQTTLNAIEALGRSGDPKAVGPLVRSLRNPIAQIREEICDALGELGDLRATNPLLSQLRDQDEGVRGAAFSALFSIGQKRSGDLPDSAAWESDFVDPTAALTQIAWKTDVEAVKMLQTALKDEDPEVRIGALYTLGQLGVAGTLEEISQIFYQDSDEDVRAAAAYALGELAQKSTADTVHFVTQALQWGWENGQGGVEVQTQILKALSELKHPHIASTFHQALTHPDSIIRQLAVIGLGRLRDPNSLQVLYESLQDVEVGVRRNAAYAIGFLDTPHAPPLLIQGAVGQGSEVRSAIGSSLKRAPRQEALHALATALKSNDSELRAVCAYLLGYLSDESGLKIALTDPHPKVRKCAALAIGSGRVRTLRTKLHKALSDPEWSVRVAAAEGLKRLKDPASLSALQSAEGDEHPIAQNAIESAIRTLSEF